MQGLQGNRKFGGVKSRDEVTLIFKVYNPVRSQRRAWQCRQSRKVSFGEVFWKVASEFNHRLEV